MKAARIHRFGPPEVIVVEDIPRPVPAAGEVLVRVAAAGVGPWDAIIREGKSKVSPQPPLTLGSDLSGVVEEVGAGVTAFTNGDEVYGVTNPQFCGAQAEYAVAMAGMVALKPQRLTHVEAASAPVVAVTAWQMLFEYADAGAGQRVMILGAAGNVGTYAVQLGGQRGLHVIGISSANAEQIESYGPVDVVIDTVGGKSRERAAGLINQGGVLVSVVSDGELPQRPGVRSVFFYADVSTARLTVLTQMFDRGELSPHVGSVMPLADVRAAHHMLAGAPHKRGKLVLTI
jgi:NADPH:quinone reductase-like Zn-dependent oxidoreductase